jgi:hypothetical protein
LSDIEVKELIGQGLSRPVIAQKLGITYHAVRIACDRLGIPRCSTGGRPPRDQSNALVNLLDQCRSYTANAVLFFRTTRGMHYFYDEPIATFTDAHAALAFVKNRTRREATRQLRRLNGHMMTPAVPHSLGAAAVHETPTPAGSGAGAAAVARIPSPSAAAAFCIVLNQPRLMGRCARLG